MTQRIEEYYLDAHDLNEQILDQPITFTPPLSVNWENGNSSRIVLTLLVKKFDRRLRKNWRKAYYRVFVDGNAVPEGSTFIGTVNVYGTMKHVFELFEPTTPP